MKVKIMKKRFSKKRLLTGLVTTILCTGITGFNITHIPMFQPSIVSAASLSYTTTGNLNIRSGPSTNYAILGTVKKGTNLTITGNTGNDWYNVSYNNKAGFVSSKYVQVSNS